MIDSVRLRMRSDVPTGTMLSAGLDSATITALVRQLKRPCSSAIGPAEEGFRNVHHAFTACWPGWHGDEEPDVDLLAAALGLRLHKLYLRAEDVPGLLSEVLYLLDEPFPSPIPVVQYLLMKMARDNGVKVVLNGHGSDEVWAGYAGRFVPRFLADLLWSGRLSRLVKEYRAFRATGELTARSFLLNSLAGLAPVRLRSRARASLRRGARELADIVPHVRPHYSPLALESASSGASLVRESLLVCFAESVLPMWLRMEDRVSMASSVESRLPFLDHRLIELGFALADSLKLRDGYTKYVLRKAMSETLPASLVSRRRKQRFRPPTSQWLGSDALQPILEDLLGGPCRVQPYLNLKAFRKRLRSYLAGEAHALNALVLWRVLNVEIWMRAFEEAQRRPAALDPRERVVVARGRTG
jgi:asparagine synthase (glutamine-hydrolysing)